MSLKVLVLFITVSVATAQFPIRPIPLNKHALRENQQSLNYPIFNENNIQAKQQPIQHQQHQQQQNYIKPSHEANFIPVIPKTPDVRRRTEADLEDEEDRYEQAKSAQYSFDSSIHDDINDGAISRQEKRNGLALEGMYSYSDGFFKRTVHYEADENGYRVVKEEIEPIGDGPRYNPQGKADVSTSLIGSYSITGDDIRDIREKDRPLRRHPVA